MKISDKVPLPPPLLFLNSPLHLFYQLLPFYGKNLNPPFRENLEISNQGIIQKSTCGSQTLPLVILDKKVPFFPQIVLF